MERQKDDKHKLKNATQRQKRNSKKKSTVKMHHIEKYAQPTQRRQLWIVNNLYHYMYLWLTKK